MTAENHGNMKNAAPTSAAFLFPMNHNFDKIASSPSLAKTAPLP